MRSIMGGLGTCLVGFLIVSLLASCNLLQMQTLAANTPRDIGPPVERNSKADSRSQKSFTGDAFYNSEALNNLFPEHLFQNSNVAVITETNPAAVPNLVPVMLQFATVLGPEWPVVLLTLQKNWKVPPSPAFQRLTGEKRIIVKYLPPKTAFPDHRSVTYFMVRRWLWELFEHANRILLFQVDSILCSRAPQRIEEFLEWDFIGAPIAKKYGHGYNGGLSIRNPKIFLEIVREQDRKKGWLKVEDQWFYDRLVERGAHMPSADVAKEFAVETVFYDKPLGYHQPVRWQKENMSEIMEWCPEVGILTGGQHFF